MASEWSCDACANASSAPAGAGNAAVRGGAANHPFEKVFSAFAESRTSWQSAPAGEAIAESVALTGAAVPAVGHAAGGAATFRISARTKAARIRRSYGTFRGLPSSK